MKTWPEEVSNEGHVYAALDLDFASSAVTEPIEDRPRRPSTEAAEELAMEEDRRWLEQAARHRSKMAMLELSELSGIDSGSPRMEIAPMLTTDFATHLERLLILRARFRGVMTHLADNALNHDHSRTTSMPTHMAELGSGNFDQELSLSLLGSERSAHDQIEAAILRIEEGSYGRCETCGQQIPEARLEALPYAAQCVQCASEQENVLTGFESGPRSRVLPR